ncbi:MAG TPA: PAS domain-containing protein [Steroidobacteraceae bacterium]|nr:PAS domain-containing protein [Steroidobacteraceae bacterium]
MTQSEQGAGGPDSAAQLISGEFFRCMSESPMSCWCWPDCFNPRMLSIGNTLQKLGYAPQELGDDIHGYLTVVHPQDKPRLETMLQDVLGHARTGDYETEFRLRRKDGTYCWVRVVASFALSSSTGCLSAFGVTRILGPTEEAHSSALQLSEDALSTVLDEIGYPVVLMTLEGQVLQQNAATARVVSQAIAPRNGIPHYCPFLHEADGTIIIPDFVESVLRSGRREDREVWRFDRWWHIYLVPLRNKDKEVRRLLLLAEDISAFKAEQEARLARERELTRTLVREVHHRIKNHLQGLVGLLRSQPETWRSVRDVIDDAVVQIQSIAAVHGLLAEDGTASIEIAALVSQVVETLRIGTSIPIRCILDPPDWQPFSISQEDAVPFAVAIGELLMNAVKHTEGAPGAYVESRLSCKDDEIELNITNAPARLPEGFSLAGSVGPGTGLDLVKALLPPDRYLFDIVQDGDAVTTRLRVKTTRARPAR